MRYVEAVMSADWSVVEKGVSLDVSGEVVDALGEEGKAYQSRIFVRKWYPMLYDELQLRGLNLGSTSLVVGTPGIGKSAFAHYLVGRLLQRRRDNNESFTVYYQYKNVNFYAFLSDGRVLSGNSVADIGILPQDEDWCIVDGARVREYQIETKPTIVVITSPSKKVVHETTKHRDGESDTFIMPMFHDDEIEVMRRECFDDKVDADDEDYLEALDLFGNVPRLVLGRIDELQDHKYLLKVDINEAASMIACLDRENLLPMWSVPHRVFNLNVDYDYHEGTVDWYNWYFTVPSGVRNELQRAAFLRHTDMALYAACFGPSSSVGDLFEKFTIQYLRSGRIVNHNVLWSRSNDAGEMGLWDWQNVDVVLFNKDMFEIEDAEIDLSRTTLFVPQFDDLSGCDCLVYSDRKIYVLQISVGGKKGVGNNKIKMLDGRSNRKGLSHAVNAIDKCIESNSRISGTSSSFCFDDDSERELSEVGLVVMVRNDVFGSYKSKLGLTNTELSDEDDQLRNMSKFDEESNEIVSNVMNRMTRHFVALSPITPTIDYSRRQLEDFVKFSDDQMKGLKKGRRTRRFSDEEKKMAARLYQQGLSVGEVRRKIGSSKSSVIRWWKLYIEEEERKERKGG